MHRHEMARGEQVVQGEELHAQCLGLGPVAFGMARPGAQLQAESGRPPGHGLRAGAEADQAQRAPGQPPHARVLARRPVAGAHGLLHGGQLARRGQQQRHRVVRLFAEAEIRHVADDDPLAGGLVDRDAVGTCAQACDGAAGGQRGDHVGRQVAGDDQQRIAVARHGEDVIRALPFDGHQLGARLRQQRHFLGLDRVGVGVEPDRTQCHGAFSAGAPAPALVNSATQRRSHSEGKACLTNGWRAQTASSSSMPRPGLSGRR